ncbi:MAG: DUF1598 domain-containing protein [Pirellulaceae bacterium]|jgi:hypothetical protein|nr:DUF1598 domain-containing protein [Pirellulaceae bacterium]
MRVLTHHPPALTVRAFACLLVLVGCQAIVGDAAGQVSNSSLRPFVTGITPVVDRFGRVVGGVSISAAGEIERFSDKLDADLRRVRGEVIRGATGDVRQPSKMRMVSLRALDQMLKQSREGKRELPEAALCLAGIQRVRYVIVDEKRDDLILAGPAEGWRVGPDGVIVGERTGDPVVLLEDLLAVFRATADSGGGDAITCSIDPSPERLARLQQMLGDRRLRVSAALPTSVEKVLGDQLITFSGVEPTTHFAQVLIAADYQMKRLAMELEPAPITGLPSYLALLTKSKNRLPKNSLPRWWIAAEYDSIASDEDGLAWRLDGQGVVVRTRGGKLQDNERVVDTDDVDGAARQWAGAMTANYTALSQKRPVFGQLRNCIDLSIVAALVWRRNLTILANYDFPEIMGDTDLQLAEYPRAKVVASHARLSRKGKQWIVSASGGVDISPAQLLQQRSVDPQLAKVIARAERTADRWWWD